MRRNPYKYPFVVISGINGGGKSTLLEGIEKWDAANNIGSIFTKEPTNGEIGQRIREILQNNGYDKDGRKLEPMELQMMFIKDRLPHRKMEAAFLELYPLFSERDFLDTIVYGVSEGVDPQWILSAHELMLGEYFFVPDLILICDLDPKEAIRRGQRSGNPAHYFELTLESRIKTREAFLKFPEIMKKFYSDVPMRIEIIDAAPPPEKILESVIPIIEEVFRKKKN